MTEMAPLTNTPRRVKLRVEDYLALDDAGAFDAYGKTELIDGEVVYMNARLRPEARIRSQLFLLVAQALRNVSEPMEALVGVSIEMPPHDVPQPDIVITDEPDGAGLIPLASVRLVVEIADAALRSDTARKAAIYARHGVQEYWVADVDARTMHQMWSVVGKQYEQQRVIKFGGSFMSMTINSLVVRTDEL